MKSKASSANTAKKVFAFLGLAFLGLLIALIYYNLNFAYTVRGNVILEGDNGAIPPSSRLVVQLEDISGIDSVPIAEQTVEDVRLPTAFKIKYDPNEIVPDGIYAVSAEIYDKDFNLVFRSEETYNVLTNDHPNQIEIRLTEAQDTGGLDLNPLFSDAGENGGGDSPAGVIAGNVTFDDALALPENASMTVRLHDNQREDAENNVVAETTQPVAISPASFELPYEADSIQAANTYGITVVVEDAEQNILFVGEAQNVITNGNPTQVDIELTPTEQ